jgi:DNA-directed RNA polymerase specialized sigma24 family protein
VITIGSVKIDIHEKERTLNGRYALDSADGVKRLLRDYHALCERRYAGDYAASDILLDLNTAIKRAGLTDRQRQALRLVYVGQYRQTEAADKLGVSKQTVNRLISVATAKIARVYEAWARMGEGYSLTITEN